MPRAIVGSRAKGVTLRAAGRVIAPHLCGKWKQAWFGCEQPIFFLSCGYYERALISGDHAEGGNEGHAVHYIKHTIFLCIFKTQLLSFIKLYSKNSSQSWANL